MKSFSLTPKASGVPARVLALFAVLCWTAAVLVSLTPAWKQVEFKLLDGMTVTAAPNKSSFPITIVGIDEASFASLKLQWPWPRSLHAELVNRLTAAGAAVVAFDVVFSEPSNKQDDQHFADSIWQANNVVLAADRVYHESSSIRQWLRVDPLKEFTEAGARTGLAAVTLDPDLVIRQVPEAGDAFWRAITNRLSQRFPQIPSNIKMPPGALIHYVGGDHTFPYVSYHEVVNPTGAIPPDFFKDQVVIVGRDVKASPDVESAQADLFATPFLASTGWLMPGAEVHANILETALAGNAITPLPATGVYGLLAVVVVAGALAMRRWRPLWSALASLAIATVVGVVTWGAFVKWNLWMPAASSLAVLPLLYVSLGGWSYLTEQARRKDITRTFSLYVTPQVVSYLIEHPEHISLGGERRELTLMFTDIKGFTSISEMLTPERVTNLLNRYFTEMTDIVLEYDGTVCTFIGDAIMAFWGAPMDDDDKAYRAVSAAVAMQKAMVGVRERYGSEGFPPIYMRIGIHSGSAIVGNLGSAKRFDYTAIGDDVNLASRLEGTNKLYGTGILVSGDTARQIEGRIGLRPVDKVIVKGKSQAVEIYTPCEDPRIVELTQQALHDFRAQQWDAAEAGWRELLAIDENDGVAKIYLKRIAEFRDTPPAPDWDGSVELEKL